MVRRPATRNDGRERVVAAIMERAWSGTELESARELLFWAMVALPAIAAVAAIYWSYFGMYAHYLPFGDDLAVMVGSLGNPLKWFTSGFSQYFVPFPEWSTGATDFVRPGVNLILRIEHIVFGEDFRLYFAALFAAHLVLCLLVVSTLAKSGTSWLSQCLFGLLNAANPAFFSDALTSISFQFDVWCGLLAFLSFYLLLNNRYVLAFACMTAAVFTKEATLYVPIAACLTVYLRTRRKFAAACMLMPLAAWLAVWKFVFVGSLSGVYVFRSSLVGPLQLLKGLLFWPTGVVDLHTLRWIFEEHSIRSHGIEVAVMLLNLVLWVALAVGAVYALRSYRMGAGHAGAHSAGARSAGVENLPLLISIWLAGALSFGTLVGHEARFGGSIYPFEILLVALMIGRSATASVRRFGVPAAAILALAFALNVSIVLAHRDPTQSYAMARLMAAIKALPRETTVVYVVNAPDSFSSPSSISEAAHSPARLVILSQFKGCIGAPDGATTIRPSSSASLSIRVQVPHCAELVFEGPPGTVLTPGIGGELTRGTFASYHFPEGRFVAAAGAAAAVGAAPTVLLFGRKLLLTLEPEATGRNELLYYDWAARSYLDVRHP